MFTARHITSFRVFKGIPKPETKGYTRQRPMQPQIWSASSYTAPYGVDVNVVWSVISDSHSHNNVLKIESESVRIRMFVNKFSFNFQGIHVILHNNTSNLLIVLLL